MSNSSRRHHRFLKRSRDGQGPRELRPAPPARLSRSPVEIWRAMRDVVGAADPTYRARALTRLRGLLLDNEVLRPRGMSLRLALHPLPNRVALFRGGVDDFLRALADQGESSPQELIYRGSIAYAVGGPIAVPWQGCYMILGAPERIGALLDSMGC